MRFWNFANILDHKDAPYQDRRYPPFLENPDNYMTAEQLKTKITQEQFHDLQLRSLDILIEHAIFEFPLRFIFNKKTTLNHKFTFTNCQFPKIEFQNVVFSNGVKFHSCQIEDNFTINSCHFNQQFNAHHISAKRIIFWSNNFESGFELYNFEKVSELILQFHRVSKKVFINQWHVNPVELDKIHITFDLIKDSPISITNLVSKSIEIQFSVQQLTESLTISDIKTSELKLFNIKNKSGNKVELLRLTVWKLLILWLHNDGILNIQELNRHLTKDKSVFDIQNSYFGYAELYHIDLNNFERVNIF